MECPNGCLDAVDSPVFGVGGVYSDLSSVCRAALHSGVIKSGGLFSVSLESSLPAYSGSESNGIISLPLNTPNTLQLKNELVGELDVEGLPSRDSGKVLHSIRPIPVAKVGHRS